MCIGYETCTDSLNFLIVSVIVYAGGGGCCIHGWLPWLILHLTLPPQLCSSLCRTSVIGLQGWSCIPLSYVSSLWSDCGKLPRCWKCAAHRVWKLSLARSPCAVEWKYLWARQTAVAFIHTSVHGFVIHKQWRRRRCRICTEDSLTRRQEQRYRVAPTVRVPIAFTKPMLNAQAYTNTTLLLSFHED